MLKSGNVKNKNEGGELKNYLNNLDLKKCFINNKNCKLN